MWIWVKIDWIAVRMRRLARRLGILPGVVKGASTVTETEMTLEEFNRLHGGEVETVAQMVGRRHREGDYKVVKGIFKK